MYLGGTGTSPTSSPPSSLALKVPGAFPDLSQAKARGLVSQHGQEGDRLGLDEFLDEGRYVEVGAAPV